MSSIQQDIETQSDWIVKAFASDNLTLDYTIRSFIDIDKFFFKHSKNGQSIKGGRLEQNRGSIIFSIGSYIGQTFIKTVPGAIWQIDKSDPEAEINAAIKFPDGTMVWPVQRVIKRYQNGPEDSVYVYGHQLTEEYLNEPFDQAFWNLNPDQKTDKKPWWKFW